VPFPGGIGTYAAGIEGALRKSGIPVRVVAPTYPDLPKCCDGPEIHRIFKHHGIGPIAMYRLLSLLRNLPEGWSVLACDIRSVLAIYLLRPFHRRVYQSMVHGSEASKFEKGSILFKIARRAYLSSKLVAFNSEATRNIFTRNIGTPEVAALTYLGVEPAWFEDAHGSFDHPDLAALPDDVNLICSVGRIEARKGQKETVTALALARDKYGLRNPVYVIAGRPEDEGYAASVVEEARRVALPIVATGRLHEDDLKRLYRRSVCHMLYARPLPGKIEGFGLVLLEAAAQACPSVGTAVGGIPEVLGDTGVVTQVDGFEEAAQAVARFASDSEWRAKQGAAAQQRAGTFSWMACARSTFPDLFQ
jgi:phosphatidylinositol alpha-1,6-mannosyltransferase